MIRMVRIMYDDFECPVLDERFKITTGIKQECTCTVRLPVPAYF